MSSRLEIEPGERPGSEEEPARRRIPLRPVLLMIAVAALAGGSWWAGHGNKPVPQDLSAVPEIHADAGPVKEVPSDRGGMVVPDQDSALLNRDAKTKPEELLPPAEAVKPRPVDTPQAPPAPALPSQAAAVAPPPVPAHAPTQPVPAPQTAAAPTVTAPVAPAAKNPMPPASAGGAYRLQLGALKSEDAARAAWLRLQKEQPDILGRLSLSISRVDLGAKGIYYRIQAGPIADAAAAAQNCAALKGRNIGCILVKP